MSIDEGIRMNEEMKVGKPTFDEREEFEKSYYHKYGLETICTKIPTNLTAVMDVMFEGYQLANKHEAELLADLQDPNASNEEEQ
jgi:hypothetical protein